MPKPKNNVRGFLWMKVENPNLALRLNCWRRGISKTSKKLFSSLFLFLVCLLFCRLFRKDLGELVLVMGWDHGYSMETLYELCESWLCERISEEISRERRDEEERNIYNVG